MTPSSVDVNLSLEEFLLNGVSIKEAAAPIVFHDVLGTPSRIIEPGQPAPVGHRNPQIHLYDELGIYLNEHHYTGLIEAVTFVLWPEESTFRPAHAFTGKLWLGGIEVRPAMMEQHLIGTSIPLTSVLRGCWSAQGDRIWISVDTKGRRLPSKRRSKQQRVVNICVCLQHDPWDRRMLDHDRNC